MADQNLDFIIAKLDALKGVPERLDNVMCEINHFQEGSKGLEKRSGIIN